MVKNYQKELEEGYNGDVILNMASVVEVKNLDKIELLNGFSGSEDTVKENFPLYNKTKAGRKSPLKLIYNPMDNMLYTSLSITFSSPLSEDEVKTSIKYFNEYIKEFKGFNSIDIGVEGIEINLYPKGRKVYSIQKQLEAPEGYLYLDSILTEEVDINGYPEFLNNLLMYNRLKSICIKNSKDIPKDAYTGKMLPIHVKDPKTGSMLVLKDVKSLYLQFKVAQNYIRGFEENTEQYQTGVLMMLSPEFSKYILGLAEMAEITGKVNTKIYRDKVIRAVKFAKKYRPSYLEGRSVNEQIAPQEETELN